MIYEWLCWKFRFAITKKLNLINHNMTFDEKTLAPFIQLINLAIKMKLEPICPSVHNWSSFPEKQATLSR